MMAHSLPSVQAAAGTPLVPARPMKTTATPLFSLGFPTTRACTESPAFQASDDKLFHRREAMSLSLAGVAMGLFLDHGSAQAAGRRGPPPPTVEKKDPSVSGVQAKVLASKKRKEAMRESMDKLRQKGKTVDQPPSSNSE